jgi:hypothetical protein
MSSFIRIEGGAIHSKIPAPVNERDIQAYLTRKNEITEIVKKTLDATASEMGFEENQSFDHLIAQLDPDSAQALIHALATKIQGRETFVTEGEVSSSELLQVLNSLPEIKNQEKFKDRLALIESAASSPNITSITIDPTDRETLQTWHLSRSDPSSDQDENPVVPEDHFPGYEDSEIDFTIPVSTHSTTEASSDIPKELKPTLKKIFDGVRNDPNSKAVTITTDKGTACFRRTPQSFKYRPVTPFCLNEED